MVCSKLLSMLFFFCSVLSVPFRRVVCATPGFPRQFPGYAPCWRERSDVVRRRTAARHGEEEGEGVGAYEHGHRRLRRRCIEDRRRATRARAAASADGACPRRGKQVGVVGIQRGDAQRGIGRALEGQRALHYPRHALQGHPVLFSGRLRQQAQPDTNLSPSPSHDANASPIRALTLALSLTPTLPRTLTTTLARQARLRYVGWRRCGALGGRADLPARPTAHSASGDGGRRDVGESAGARGSAHRRPARALPRRARHHRRFGLG